MAFMWATKDGRFVFQGTFDERDIPKRAGFRWDTLSKEWYTYNSGTAARLREYADQTAKDILSKVGSHIQPWMGRLTWKEMEKNVPYNFQKDSAIFALGRTKSYLGLDPGLGKTIVASIIIHTERQGAVYICPPGLCATTEGKLNTWSDYRAQKLSLPMSKMPGTLIIPDSMLTRFTTIEAIKSYVTLAGKKGMSPRLFIDEAHRFKDEKAKRSKSLFQNILPLFKNVTLMSGTPMPNRPMELYGVLSHIVPETIDFMTGWEYGLRYCAGYKNKWGWDFTGVSNIEDLAKRLKKDFMIRFRKSEVLKELPEKINELVLIDDTLPAQAARIEKDFIKQMKVEELIKTGSPHVATYRRLLGIAKVKPAISFIKEILEETDENLLVFAHHKEVIKTLGRELDCLIIDGSVSTQIRSFIIEDWSNDSEKRVLVLNIQAGGIGYDLTKATRVIFVEYDWVPGNNEQASDRAHRIGQHDSVLVQYLVYKDSLDKQILETLLEKQKAISHV